MACKNKFEPNFALTSMSSKCMVSVYRGWTEFSIWNDYICEFQFYNINNIV